MRHFRHAFLSAVVLTACLNHAASATTIDFNTLPGTYESAFKTYTENGFTVATKTGHFYVDPVGVNPAFGDPAPDIFADDSLSKGQDAESLTLTKVGGGSFTFTSVDVFASNALPTYTLTGFLGKSQVYSQNASLPTTATPTPNGFEVFNPGVNALSVTSVVLGFSDVGLDPLTLAGVDLDNFVLNGTTPVAPTPTPEPQSVVMLGTGLLSLGGIVRRRLQR